MPSLSSSLRPWRRLKRRSRRRVVDVVALAGGVGAVMAGATPTASGVGDVVVSFVAGLVATWLVAGARRWALPFTAAGAAFLATDMWLVVGLVGLAIALAGLTLERRDRVVGAIVGALAVQCLFRLPTDHGFAIPTLVAAVSLAPAALSTIWNADADRRRIAVWASLGVAAVVGVIGTLTGLAAFEAESVVSDAIDSSRQALDEVRNDERRSAAASFGQAAAQFGDVEDAMAQPWTQAARFIPVLGQHVESVDSLAGAGRELALTSAETIETLDLDGLEFSGGRIDLDRVAALADPAQAVVDETEVALATIDDARSPWLVPMLRDRIDDLAVELEDALPGARTTVWAAQQAPSLLGADEERTYLVLFTMPAEGREIGGFVGNAGILTADDGRLEYENIDRIGDLNDELQEMEASLPDVRLPSAYLATEPQIYPQNWGSTADFPTVAQVSSHVMEQVRPEFEIDGVMLVDPYTLAGVLEMVGPVTVPEVDIEITADNAVDFLLREQYLVFDDDAQGERKELLRDVGEAAFERLTSGQLPAPPIVARTLGPLVDQRRLLAWVEDPDSRALFDSLGLSGALDQRAEPGDEVISVVESNIRANKIDAYIHRDISIEGRVLGNGELRGTLTVSIDNRVPEEPLNDYVLGDGGQDLDGLPEGTHWMFATVYSSIAINEATVDGKAVALAAEVIYDLTRYTVLVQVPQGETVDVTFTLSDKVDAGRFDLNYVPYAGANQDSVDISVATP